MSAGRKKSYEIIKRSKRSKDIKGIFSDAGKHKRMAFDDEGRMVVHDAGVAREIEQKFGSKGSKDVVVVEVDDLHPENTGRSTKRIWSINLPWKKG
jgi:hypothetical protein